MDKVRAFLKVVYQQRFWVLSGVGVIIAAVCWMMAARSLDAEFTVHKTEIEGKFKEMGEIAGKPVHGNESVNEHERAETKKIRDRVLALWKKMYDRQRAQVLKWPASLGDEFLEYVQDMKFRDNIAKPEIRNVYREFAKDRFPALIEIVKAKKMAEGDMAAGGGRGGGFDGYAGRGGGMDGAAAPQTDQFGNVIPTEKYIVEWLDQDFVRQELSFSARPSSLQIWVTQEDLWVYETLLHVIARTNEDNNATRPDNAAIRGIMALEVGEKAAFASKTPGVVMVAAPLAGGEMDATGMGRGGEMAMTTEGGMPSVDPDAMLLANRYIGPEGTPIADGSTVSGGEFRMLPVRMQLMMEQKAIPSILIECANAALPIEVKRVRINAEKSGDGFPAMLAVATPGGGGGGEFSRGGGGGMDGGRGMGSFDGGGGGGRGGGETMSMTMTPGTSASGLATVEIHGIVYIYNPPDATLLPGGDDDATATDSMAAAEPATTPL